MILVVAAVAVVVAADLGLLLKLLRCLSVGLPLAQRVPGGGRRRRAAVGRRHDDAELVEKRLRLRVGETLSSEHLLDPVAVRSREVLLDQALERKATVDESWRGIVFSKVILQQVILLKMGGCIALLTQQPMVRISTLPEIFQMIFRA